MMQRLFLQTDEGEGGDMGDGFGFWIINDNAIVVLFWGKWRASWNEREKLCESAEIENEEVDIELPVAGWKFSSLLFSFLFCSDWSVTTYLWVTGATWKLFQ